MTWVGYSFQTANKVERAEDLPRSIPGRTIVLLFKTMARRESHFATLSVWHSSLTHFYVIHAAIGAFARFADRIAYLLALYVSYAMLCSYAHSQFKFSFHFIFNLCTYKIRIPSGLFLSLLEHPLCNFQTFQYGSR